MGLTKSNLEHAVAAGRKMAFFDLSMDSSYPFGGESLTKMDLGLDTIDLVTFETKGPVSLSYDYTNFKVKAHMPAPIWRFEEKHTISAGKTVTLDYPAAYIQAVVKANDPYKMTDSDATLGAGDCSFTITSGELTTIQFHSGATGDVLVTYITQAWKELSDNVVTEIVTTASHVGILSHNALAIQSVRAIGTTGVNCASMLVKGDTVASKEVKIDWTPAATKTSLTFFATDAILSAVVTYIKCPESGLLLNNFVEEETATLSTNTQQWDYPMLLWSYAGQIPIDGQATQFLINQGGTAGTGEGYLRWRFHPQASGDMLSGETNQATAAAATYVKGVPEEVMGQWIEVIEGTDLSSVRNVKVIVYGS